MKRILLLMILSICSSNFLLAQVTTSSISGQILDLQNQPLFGASVEAIHMPTNSSYGMLTDGEGNFYLSNVKSGGPYKIIVSYIGYKTWEYEGLNLRLGENSVINATLAEDSKLLEEVTVIYEKNALINNQRTGASTNISSKQLSSLPSISRSITDFTRLSPQSQGTSFAGRDGRYNNLQIDGSNFNNNFGLSSNPLPGGGSQPISLDAISEVQVNVAPYDVRQSNFTGAGINAVTRYGTNQLSGSVYGYYKNQNFNGLKVAADTLPTQPDATSRILGARLGGAIIKDKLFFFVNGEFEKNVRPGITIIPSDGSRTGSNVSRTTLADMNLVKDYVTSKYGYNPGRLENYANEFVTQNYKALARIDWNISQKHKFNLRYTQMVATDDQLVNGTSAPNPRSSSNRISLNSYAFENANYGFENSVKSLAAELTSVLRSNLSNQVLATFTNSQDKRTSKSSPFPFIDIKKGGDSYLSLGYELFSWKNDVVNKTFTFTDNVTYKMGKHTFTGGVTFDYLSFGNSFQRYGTSYYRYDSLNQFLNNQLPSAYAITYSLLPGGKDPYAELDFGLGGLYVQDEFNVNSRLKITPGIRVDLPFYFNDLLANEAVNKANFVDIKGTNTQKLDVSQWPTSKPLFSPRIGFNYDVKGDKTLQLRGGTGLFTGRVPFVWFTNLPTNSGMLQNTVEFGADSIRKYNMLFSSNPSQYINNLPQVAGQSLPGSIAAIDKNFKMPQVWRTSIGLDYKTENGWIATFEGIFTKDINAVIQYNANQKAPNSTLTMNANNGQDKRPIWFGNNSLNRVNSGMSEAMVLTNTDQGSSYLLTLALAKEFNFGLSFNIAYTYTNAKDLSSNPGSQAASAWSNNAAVRGQNDLDLAWAEAVPHRFMSAVSYRFEWLGHLGTTLSLFYDGSHQGRYSYRYTSDFNRDGINADLIYIPRNPSEITFTDVTGANPFTAQQQSDAFFKFIDQDPYLKNKKGQYAERNGALLPWRNRFDFKLLQDIFNDFGGRRHTLQFSLDILNIGNLLNSNWGINKTSIYNNGAILSPNVNATTGTATFQMARVSNRLPASSFNNVIGLSSTWSMQVGLRYSF